MRTTSWMIIQGKRRAGGGRIDVEVAARWPSRPDPSARVHRRARRPGARARMRSGRRAERPCGTTCSPATSPFAHRPSVRGAGPWETTHLHQTTTALDLPPFDRPPRHDHERALRTKPSTSRPQADPERAPASERVDDVGVCETIGAGRDDTCERSEHGKRLAQQGFCALFV